MKARLIDRLLMLAIVCAILLHTFWQRPTATQSDLKYIPGKPDTTIINVHVDFPEIVFPSPAASIPAVENKPAGIVPENCDSIRYYRQVFTDSSGASATVEDTVHGKLLWRRLAMDFKQLRISKTDTVIITNPSIAGSRWAAGPYLCMQLDTGSVVRMKIGAMYSGRTGAWTATYTPGRKIAEIGRAFYLFKSKK